MLPEGLNFQFTMNFGQVLQVVSVVVPALVWLVKYGSAHAVMKQRIDSTSAELQELKDDVKDMKNVLYGLPSMMVSLHRTPKTIDNGERSGHGFSLFEKVFENAPEGLEEIKRIGELLAEMRKADK